MNVEKSPESFFADLLALTEQQFKQSPAYQKQLKRGQQWNYAVCATPIAQRKGIIFGINWGGSDGYKPQTKYPSGKDIVEYPFIYRIRKSLTSHLSLDFEELNFNYTNLCFFRTPTAYLLENDDFKLSLSPFEEFVKYINPPWLLSIGLKNIDTLNNLGLLSDKKWLFDDEERFSGFSGRLWDWNIFAVPHPNAHIKGEARAIIWEKVIIEMVKEKCLFK